MVIDGCCTLSSSSYSLDCSSSFHRKYTHTHTGTHTHTHKRERESTGWDRGPGRILNCHFLEHIGCSLNRFVLYVIDNNNNNNNNNNDDLLYLTNGSGGITEDIFKVCYISNCSFYQIKLLNGRKRH